MCFSLATCINKAKFWETKLQVVATDITSKEKVLFRQQSLMLHIEAKIIGIIEVAII